MDRPLYDELKYYRGNTIQDMQNKTSRTPIPEVFLLISVFMLTSAIGQLILCGINSDYYQIMWLGSSVTLGGLGFAAFLSVSDISFNPSVSNVPDYISKAYHSGLFWYPCN